ncbi:MAG: helix-turn-helix transcriptional regulator [Clostridia bacterium]|nr:helix-turn-helix transcriptional regulator [Clostridia bacterium]
MRVLFGKGRKSTDSDSQLILKVNNCGSYKEVDEDVKILRSEGRKDYHLLFVANGEFRVDGIAYASGHCALYRPNEPHNYVYKSAEGSVYYWLHFTGTDAGEIVKDFDGRCLCYNDKSSDVNNILEMMISACVNGGDKSEEYIATLLRALCILLCEKKTEKPFAKAIAMMRDFSQQHVLADYAQASFMSEGHFTKAFKTAYGITPLKYKTKLQTDHAKFLLASTSLKVSAVSALSGFCDPLYFSRVFKKNTGYSPEQYRKNL